MPKSKKRQSSGHYSSQAPESKSQRTQKDNTQASREMEEQTDTGAMRQIATDEAKPSTANQDSLTLILQKLECLPDIQTSVKDMSKTLAALQQSLQYTQGEVDGLKNITQEQKKTITKQSKNIDDLESKVGFLTNENKKLREDLTALEAYGRRENLLFDNITEHPDENCLEIIKEFIEKQLKISTNEMNFQRVHRLGTPNKDQKPRPIIVRFLQYPHRELVWSKRMNLKGSKFVLREDFPIEIERERKALFPLLKAAREKSMKARLVGRRLIVDGESYTINTSQHLAQRLNMREKGEKVISDKFHLFAGRFSPLSNFYNARFTVEGQQYTSSEQFYQYKKAVFAKEHEKAAQIMATNDPFAIKKLGDTLQINNKLWLTTDAVPVMTAGLSAKFHQNRDLAQVLLGTGSRRLVECTGDRTWGIGLPIWNKTIEDITAWKGDNRLGTCLEEVRKTLR